jgi:predicted N-acetyltransferase YhbS
MEWTVRELASAETHTLRRAVSADGRTDIPSMHHDLDDAHGSWHLGATDAAGRIVAISSFYLIPYPARPEAQPSVELAFMAVDSALQGRGIGSAVMAEAIQRLKATDAIILWANARDSALRFYQRFGFTSAPGSGYTPPETGRPHTLIELGLVRAQTRAGNRNH